MYEAEGGVNVDLNVVTDDARVKMAHTKHKTLKRAEQFFTETLQVMEDIYGYNKS